MHGLGVGRAGELDRIRYVAEPHTVHRVGERQATAGPVVPERWALLREHLTADLVRRHFGEAVSGSTALDGHGKTLSYHLLALELPA